MSKFFNTVASFFVSNPEVLPETTALPGVETNEVRQAAIVTKLVSKRAEAKALKDAAAAKAAAEAEALRVFNETPLHVFREAVIKAADAEGFSIKRYAEKIGALHGFEVWKFDVSAKGMKKLSSNEVEFCKPLAAERTALIQGLQSGATYASKGYTYWTRTMDALRAMDPNAPDRVVNPKRDAKEAAQFNLKAAYKKLHGHKDYALDQPGYEKLKQISDLMEAALLLTGVRSIEALRTELEI